jgi:hypothetical protein
MKKRVKCTAVMVLCAGIASVPLLYGQQTDYGYDQYNRKYLKAWIKVGDDTLLYVGSNNLDVLSCALSKEFGYGCYLGMDIPSDITKIWNPNPGLSPNVIKWMKTNKIKMCGTCVEFANDAGSGSWSGAYVNVYNEDGTFTTAIFKTYG